MPSEILWYRFKQKLHVSNMIKKKVQIDQIDEFRFQHVDSAILPGNETGYMALSRYSDDVQIEQMDASMRGEETKFAGIVAFSTIWVIF